MRRHSDESAATSRATSGIGRPPLGADLQHAAPDRRHQPDRVIIPPGTQIIESFSTADGKQVVNETLIAGVGLIRGALPPPRADGTIELVLTPEIVIDDDRRKK
jgi:hypothetical protein